MVGVMSGREAQRRADDEGLDLVKDILKNNLFVVLFHNCFYKVFKRNGLLFFRAALVNVYGSVLLPDAPEI